MTPSDLVVAVLLVSGMLAMGTLLDPAALRTRLASPAPLVLAVVANVAALPLLGLLLVRGVDLEPAVALGLVLAAACPGGGTGALLALHARGDVAHAVTLQGLLALGSLAVTPLWLSAAASSGTVAAVDLAPLVLALLVLQLGPLVGGMVLRSRRPSAAARVHAVARRTADVTLGLLVVGLTVAHASDLGRIGAPALTVAATLVLLSLLVAAVPVGPAAVRRSAGASTAVRNLSLALLAATFAPDPGLTSLAVLAYGLVMYLLTIGAVVAVRRQPLVAA